MADQPGRHIHPTAVVSAQANLAPDVRIGAHCVIEGEVRLGAGCILDERCYLIGPLTLGRGNHVASHAVLGEPAQHLKHGFPSGLEIGDRNTFRARVTVHQGTIGATRIGDGNHFLADAHVAHDCRIGDGGVFAVGTLLGGHCVVGDGVRMGRRSGAHQFCRLGRLSWLRAAGLTTKDIPPFIVQHGCNAVRGVNLLGMRRTGLTAEQTSAMQDVFEIVYRHGLTVSAALAQAEKLLGDSDVVQEFMAFVRTPGRGINIAGAAV